MKKKKKKKKKKKTVSSIPYDKFKKVNDEKKALVEKSEVC